MLCGLSASRHAGLTRTSVHELHYLLQIRNTFYSVLRPEQKREGERQTERCDEEKGNEKLENRKLVRRICTAHGGTRDGHQCNNEPRDVLEIANFCLHKLLF